ILLRADSEASLERRAVLFLRAAETAADPELARKARARKARLSYDLVKSHGALARSELLGAATELEATGEHELAAEAYKMLGDTEGEVRALTAAGAIDKLEERLSSDAVQSKKDRERAMATRRATDLDRGGERRAALRVTTEALALGPDDRLEDLARVIRQRLLRGPTCDLIVSGEPVSLALGERVTIGRGGATIVVASRSVSREHVVIRRDGDRVIVEDLGTRNGTFIAGARIAAPVPIGDGLSLMLGTDLPCRVAPRAEGGVTIEVAGGAFVAPLGPLLQGAWKVDLDVEEGESFVVLKSSPDAPAYLGDLQAAQRIDLAAGDAVAEERGGKVLVRVGAGTT
ncbi:MAG: FHA domain-containing protein, partial [Polyangiaceae bacterium]|nr:FHA domain-containing protein [Polyangiaceae bacterium]